MAEASLAGLATSIVEHFLFSYALMYFNRGRLPWQGLKASSIEEKYENFTRHYGVEGDYIAMVTVLLSRCYHSSRLQAPLKLVDQLTSFVGCVVLYFIRGRLPWLSLKVYSMGVKCVVILVLNMATLLQFSWLPWELHCVMWLGSSVELLVQHLAASL